MTIRALQAAKELCSIRGWQVTNLEANKILYIAQMTALGRSNGEHPLVAESFEAWDYGPVLPSVYRLARIFGDQPIRDIFPPMAPVDDASAATIREVAEALADKSPGQLVAITHWERGAWARHYLPGVRHVVIPNNDILDEYRRRAQ